MIMNTSFNAPCACSDFDRAVTSLKVSFLIIHKLSKCNDNAKTLYTKSVAVCQKYILLSVSLDV
jgi:hypothetical protein